MYNTVVEDVIASVREAFLDEGVDEQVLQELKHVSETEVFMWVPLYARIVGYGNGRRGWRFMYLFLG